MEFDEYDVFGNFKEFENANIDALLASAKPTENQSINNDSQSFDEFDDSLIKPPTSNKNMRSIPTTKRVASPIKSLPNKTTNIQKKTNEKGRKSKSNYKGPRTRSQRKKDLDESQNVDDNYDFSSDSEADNLFSILDKKKSSSDIGCEDGDSSKKNPVLNPPINTQKGRARRSYMSKLAEEILNSSIVEIPDKETPVFTGPSSRTAPQRRRPRDPNVISIGSDSEYDETENLPPIAITYNATNLATSFSDLDSENPEIDIKIEWREKIEVHKLRKFQKFSNIMQILADREHCDVHDVLLNLNNKVIWPNDSPNNISYKSYDIISGRIVKNTHPESLISKHNNSNEIQLKVQSSNWKKRIVISVNPNDPVSHMYIKISEDITMATDKFLLYLDGEVLKKDVKICDLDVEEGEILDLVMKK